MLTLILQLAMRLSPIAGMGTYGADVNQLQFLAPFPISHVPGAAWSCSLLRSGGP